MICLYFFEILLIFLRDEVSATIRLTESSSEKISGANADRPQLKAMLNYVREGIEIAKAQGKYKGRKPIEIDWTRFGQLYGEWRAKHITGRDFMRRMNMSANTFYRRVREYELRHGITEPTSA